MRVAVVGCGAIAEQGYLPALANLSRADLTCLVDADLSRAQRLAERYRVATALPRAEDLPDTIDVAVIALPHDLHHSIGCSLLARGMNVFCEKPLACSGADADAMVRCAEQHGVRLGVGNIRRLYWSSLAVRDAIASGRFGRLQHVRCDEGVVYDWPSVSGFFFDRARSGGGVLMDTGAHVVDLVLWWLGEYPGTVVYADDDYGGVEAECVARFGFPSGVEAEVRLSRLAKLRNRYVLRFERGEVVYNPYDQNAITIRPADRRPRSDSGPDLAFETYFARMLEGFLEAVRTKDPTPLDGRSVLPSIRLIEQCYASATRLEAPWLPGAAE